MNEKGWQRDAKSDFKCATMQWKKNWEIDKRHGTMGNVTGDGKDVWPKKKLCNAGWQGWWEWQEGRWGTSMGARKDDEEHWEGWQGISIVAIVAILAIKFVLSMTRLEVWKEPSLWRSCWSQYLLVKLRGEKTYCAAIMHRNTIHTYDEGGQLLFLFC